jgi:hypothetical protein
MEQSIFRVEKYVEKEGGLKSDGEKSCFPPVFTLVSYLDYYLTLKIKAIFSPEASVDSHQITGRYFPEDRTLHNHRGENLKSYIDNFMFAYDTSKMVLHFLQLHV